MYEGQVLQIITEKSILINANPEHLILIFIVTKSKRLWSLQEMLKVIQSGVGTLSSLEDLLKFMMPVFKMIHFLPL